MRVAREFPLSWKILLQAQIIDDPLKLLDTIQIHRKPKYYKVFKSDLLKYQINKGYLSSDLSQSFKWQKDQIKKACEITTKIISFKI